MAVANTISVEVAYADPLLQILLAIELPAGSSVADALAVAQILQRIPQIDTAAIAYGIHGRICGIDEPLNDGDRVEIYRPLSRDPMTARRQRIDRQNVGPARR